MKIKQTSGTEYIFNSIATFPTDKYIDLIEFTSDIISQGFYTDYLIGINLWINLIKHHNEKV